MGGFMHPVVVLKERVVNHFRPKSVARIQRSPGRPTVLIATIDPEIREALADLLEFAAINAIWVGSVEDVNAIVARERIAACLCGFWLQDGTYREVVRNLRREGIEIPTIILSAPLYPQEYRDYLAAMNLGALDFLAYPYQKRDFDRMLESAIAGNSRSAIQQDSRNGHGFRVLGAA
jgi:DNA-binding NtrC family response regulator